MRPVKRRPDIDGRTGRFIQDDYTGKKFGRLTFVRPSSKTGAHRYWVVNCDCGVTKEVRFGKALSCGCYRSEMTRNKLRTHGKSKTKEYVSWRGLISRCKHPSNPCFKYYGGKGIKVCERWGKSFVNFLNDMGPAPSKKHSVDRADPNKNYSPENCRWATPLEQGANKTNAIFIRIGNETQQLPQWAKALNVNLNTLRTRFRRGQWPTGEFHVSKPSERKDQSPRRCSKTSPEVP